MKEKHFVLLPSGLILDLNQIVYCGKVNAIKEEGKRKPSSWTISIQLEYTTEPLIFNYTDEKSARDDYNKLLHDTTGKGTDIFVEEYIESIGRELQ